MFNIQNGSLAIGLKFKWLFFIIYICSTVFNFTQPNIKHVNNFQFFYLFIFSTLEHKASDDAKIAPNEFISDTFQTSSNDIVKAEEDIKQRLTTLSTHEATGAF